MVEPHFSIAHGNEGKPHPAFLLMPADSVFYDYSVSCASGLGPNGARDETSALRYLVGILTPNILIKILKKSLITNKVCFDGGNCYGCNSFCIIN